ncbi:MAG: hypothetical protein IT368_06970 [Candidatus Hydrogenedentes bacterium]|nr:hypothetical protein [Candidatus Hydrogenedentota bacterium]
MARAEDDRSKDGVPAGMPLGGIGTGGVELDDGGRFCNLTLNGGRDSEHRVPDVPGAWPAVVVRTADGIYARRLQADGGEPQALSGLHRSHIAPRMLFPTTHYRLNDPNAPAEITWTAFTPLVPFDHDAAVLPVFFISVLVRNRSAEVVDAAVLFNWPNLVPSHDGPAAIMPVLVDHEEGSEPQKLRPEAMGAAPAARRRQQLNGLTFGTPGAMQYCLALRPHDAAEVSLAAWNPADEDDATAFSRVFARERTLLGLGRFGPNAAGAACASFMLAPGASHRCDFAFAWYTPRFGSQGEFASAYSDRFADAVTVARHGLQHIHYFYAAVEGWQQHFTRSSLPEWFSRWMINTTSVFTTNSIAMSDGSVAFFESPAAARTARLDQRLHTSFPTLLFLPRFEETEQQLLMNADPPPELRGLCGHLGRLTIADPRWQAAPETLLERTSILALLVYRDFCLTGKLVNFSDGYARIVDLIDAVLLLDHDRDGLPEQGQHTVLYDGAEVEGLNSYTSGLWLAALRACALMAHHQQDVHYGERLATLLTRASASFEKTFWAERLGLYSLHPMNQTRGVPACHTAQLAGQWYADFLGLGTLSPPARIERALMTIREVCGRHAGLVSGRRLDNAQVSAGGASEYGWPGFTAAHYCSLMLYRGKAREGLSLIEQQYHQIRKAGTPFNQASCWNLEKGAPAPGALERHLSSLGVWHVLYALEGFLLNVPEQRLRLWPNLPKPMDTLDAPLFTPTCFGRVKYREVHDPQYQQRITLTLDSPIRVKTLDLRVPRDFAAVRVGLEVDQSGVPCQYQLSDTDLGKRLLVFPAEPITLDQSVEVNIRPGEVQEVRRGLFRRR